MEKGKSVSIRPPGPLAHPMFRLIWCGAFLSNIGNWMENSAQNWAVVTQVARDRQAFWSEILNFADFSPALLLVLLAGVITDRVNVKRYLLLLQCLACLLGALLAGAAWMGYASPMVVIAFTFAEGIVWALNGPPWQAVVPALVPRSLLPRAVALNALQFNLARLTGPVLAGFVILHFGIPMAFTINAVSFALVIYAIARLPAEAQRPAGVERPLLGDMMTGIALVRRHPGLRRLALMLCIFMFLSAPLQGLLAVYVTTVLHGDSRMFGLLLGAIGTGAVCGALVIGRIPSYYPRHHLIPLAMCLACLAILGFSFTSHPAASFGVLVIVGFFYMLTLNSSNAATQLLAADPNRGRILSVILLCNQGALPLGHLFAAGLTHFLSPVMVIRSTASVLLVVAGWFLLRREPAIDAMERRRRRFGVVAGVWEALTAQSHRPIPEAVKSDMAGEAERPNDLTPHG